ncbi:MAG: hypothetical protein HQ536_03260 [Parcubacteria group bacterium]|nr:hypothetical protein [Parcubacteria group bacterium]
MSVKKCLICGESFDQESVIECVDSELVKKYPDGRGGIDRCLSCMLPDREEECQALKAGDGQQDFVD